MTEGRQARKQMKRFAAASVGAALFAVMMTGVQLHAAPPDTVVGCVDAAGQLHIEAAAGGCKKNETPSTFVAQLRIDGLNNDNPTPIFSFTLGATSSASTSGGGAGAGKVTFANLVVSKMLDGDSVPLLQAAATGQVLKKLTIDVFAIGASAPFATYTFENAIVTSNVLGSTTSAVSEQDAFDFTRITSDVTFNGQTFHSCFDIKALSTC